MEKKPLTAEDLVKGVKYKIDNVIGIFRNKNLDGYTFMCDKHKILFTLKEPLSAYTITPYTEPNQTTMNTDYTEQPFNLETALKHPEWVRTRDGREIDFIKEYDKGGTQYVLSAVLKDGRCFSYNKQGQFDSGNQCLADLILRVPCVTKWFNVYKNTGYSSKEEADKSATLEHRIACVPVKIPAI